jgi:hypothetical protein
MFEKFIVGGLVVLGFLIVLGLLIALPIQLLWNWLCPILFGLPAITFWQALGLFALVRCLWPTTTKG